MLYSLNSHQPPYSALNHKGLNYVRNLSGPYQPRRQNASLLEKYQPDIDALCERFSKEGLLNLMTVTDQNNDRQMKPASGIVDVISSLAENSNQISFFQDVAILKEWCTQQSREFYQLALKIYADESDYQNRIPGRVIRRIKKFIDRGWANESYSPPSFTFFSECTG